MEKSESKRNIYSNMKRLLILVFIAGVVIIGTYPFRNQSVRMCIDTDKGNVYHTFTYEEILNMDSLEIPMDDLAGINIGEIRFSRGFRTVCVDKITNTSLGQYAVLDTERNVIVFNENIFEKMLDLSKSFFEERIFYAECYLCIILFLWIVINALQEKTLPNNYDNHGPIYEIGKFIASLKKYGEYMNYAAKADLKAEVANSYLNRLWWLLEPIFNMIVYVIVFGKIMGNSIQNYATYIFSSLLMWNYFSKIVNYSVRCIRSNKDIITKVYVPKHVLLITNMILNFYKLLFSLTVLVPMLIIFKTRIGFSILWMFPAYALLILISYGVGLLLLHYGVYVDDLGYAVGILLNMMMFLSGIFYDVITSLPVPLNGIMMALNPVAMIVDTMRNALLYNRVTNVPLIAVWTVIGVLVSYIGLHIVYRNENGYVKVV